MTFYRSIFLPALAALLTVAGLWYFRHPVEPTVPDMKQVRKEAAAGGYRLINTAELRVLFESDPQGVLLVDTRQEWEYRSGHIKGAASFPLEPTWWARWLKKGALDAFLGGDKQKTIVFY